jgi:hypothetical protein
MAAMAAAMAATASVSIAFNDLGGSYPTPGYQPERGRRYRNGKSAFQIRIEEMQIRKAQGLSSKGARRAYNQMRGKK